MTLLTLFAWVWAGTARAQDDGAGDAGDPDDVFGEDEPRNDVTVTVQPMSLLNGGMVQGAGELNVGDDRSVALTGGYGSENGRPLYTVGGQVKQYVLGDFDTGLNVGAEATYGNADDKGFNGTTVTAGPFVGLKATIAVLSVEAQGGGQVVYDAEGVEIEPLVHLSAGVSF